MARVSITPDSAVERVSTCAASASTTTVVDRSPTFSDTSSAATCPTRSTRPDSTVVSKPARLAVRR